MNTTTIGRLAEQAAVDYLKSHGYEIVVRNWRTQAAEIDVVASHNHVIYFVEVKYRQQQTAGGGLAYITKQKLHHMRRAAQLWCLANNHDGDYELAAIEVSGSDFDVSEFIENLT